MSEECKYCKTSQTCLEMADYGSFYCLLHREIPRVIEKTYEELQQENQELKKQLEEINNFINKAGFVNIQQLMLDYCAKVEQQKKFIEWLEKESKEVIRDAGYHQRICLDVLEKYKEIIKIERN